MTSNIIVVLVLVIVTVTVKYLYFSSFTWKLSRVKSNQSAQSSRRFNFHDSDSISLTHASR